jgi:hypothetical protein
MTVTAHVPDPGASMMAGITLLVEFDHVSELEVTDGGVPTFVVIKRQRTKNNGVMISLNSATRTPFKLCGAA